MKHDRKRKCSVFSECIWSYRICVQTNIHFSAITFCILHAYYSNCMTQETHRINGRKSQKPSASTALPSSEKLFFTNSLFTKKRLYAKFTVEQTATH